MYVHGILFLSDKDRYRKIVRSFKIENTLLHVLINASYLLSCGYKDIQFRKVVGFLSKQTKRFNDVVQNCWARKVIYFIKF